MLNISLLIFLGSGVGGTCRFWLANLMYHLFGRHFPIGTLFVNVTGSLLMGFLFVLFSERLTISSSLYQPLFLIGFLGGYTTFSSFSIETVNLIQAGSLIHAALNIVLSLSLCLLATWLGVLLGRSL